MAKTKDSIKWIDLTYERIVTESNELQDLCIEFMKCQSEHEEQNLLNLFNKFRLMKRDLNHALEPYRAEMIEK